MHHPQLEGGRNNRGSSLGIKATGITALMVALLLNSKPDGEVQQAAPDIKNPETIENVEKAPAIYNSDTKSDHLKKS